MLLKYPTDCCSVMRGLWYLEADWQPIDEEDSERLEDEHLFKFEGQNQSLEVFTHKGVIQGNEVYNFDCLNKQ